MNKSGFAMSMLGKIVLVVLLVLVVSGTLIVNIAWGGDKMTSCKAAGGEPLPINTPNRELVPNYAGIGRDLKKAQDADNSGIPYACFVADYATGRGARLNDEDIPGGYHFYLLTYPDYPAENIAINPAPSNEFAYKPKDAEEFERTLIDGHSLNLEENRLYGFQAYIKNQENKFCSIYLREGGENQGSADSNIKGGYVKRVKCDEAESAPILFYVPKKKHMSAVDYKQPIDIVLLPRKTYEGAADWDNDHAVTITVNPVVGPCNSRFQVLGADKTDVSALQEGKYQNNNPVTFTLHDNSVTAKFNNVVISPNIVI
ncbi:MAG: hypothetical protein KKG59_00300, partial [Nanoarchaeota archaeon]|nr:hypothetical protein [Nanoarchaeota archaeon]